MFFRIPSGYNPDWFWTNLIIIAIIAFIVWRFKLSDNDIANALIVFCLIVIFSQGITLLRIYVATMITTWILILKTTRDDTTSFGTIIMYVIILVISTIYAMIGLLEEDF